MAIVLTTAVAFVAPSFVVVIASVVLRIRLRFRLAHGLLSGRRQHLNRVVNNFFWLLRPFQSSCSRSRSLCSHCCAYIPSTGFSHKTNISGYLDLVCPRNPNPILMGSAVSHHNSFEIARIQFLGFLLWHVHECLCTNSNEVRDVRLLAIQGLVGCHSLESRCWAAILEMRNGASEFGPKLLWEARFSKNCSNPFADRPVCSFGNAVLLWCVWGRFLVMDSSLPAQFGHLLSIFPATVRSDRFDASSVLFKDIAELEKAFSHLLCCL